ncbi:hypothetical protein WMY93_013944 [Mugilogobius chulae]|uniref:RRM domain-containing protein n=1 Tax=Mugilogobius chulae TaxID=88201 RepID=A0AAW0P2Z3_9GOBI
MPAIPPQAVGTCFHCTVNQALYASGQAAMLNDFTGIQVVPAPASLPPQPQPQPQPRTVGGEPVTADRTIHLRNSAFKLIYENIYLALTDSKLLGWYLALSPPDRKIIQDEGGLHQFLRKHPGLELSKHHVYVKKVVSEELREHFPLSGNSVNSYNQYQGNHYQMYSSPASQRLDPKVQELSKLTWPMASTSNGFTNPEQFANLSLDVELERHIQGVHPQSTAVDVNSFFRGANHDSSGNENFYSILEADKSIVLCVPNQSPEKGSVSEKEASIIESVISTTEDRSTSPMTCVCTCDAMVGTEQAITKTTLTQTESQQTSDKHLNTEVFMLDLDYLTKEFITIKTERDELLEKVKMQRITSPFARIVNDLKKLETEYNKMREKILSGISLQDLKPLYTDRVEADASAVATITSDIQKMSVSSQQHDTLKETSSSDDNSQDGEMVDFTKCDSSTAKRAVTRIPKDKVSNQRTDGKDSVSSEDWFDAEEDLSSEGSGESEETDIKTTDKSKAVSAGLCVTGLPSNVTEKDLMMWFQKYNVSDVHISNFKELSVAIVIVETQQSAEAALRELNGLRVKGQSLQVERINSGRSEDQGQSSGFNSEPESKTQNQLSSSSSPKKKVVCVSPTAQGTFVPQHYGTMGSFDILMSELTQRHPSVSRQRIVDALLELRAKYRGVLSGLPLRTIRDMTSDLLIRPANT